MQIPSRKSALILPGGEVRDCMGLSSQLVHLDCGVVGLQVVVRLGYADLCMLVMHDASPPCLPSNLDTPRVNPNLRDFEMR